MLEEKNRIIPSLRVNNRKVNQTFLEKQLGLKTILEDGPFAEFAGHSADKATKLVLTESPSMRTRAVEGVKKLAKLTLKVQNPAEIEGLLARGSSFRTLYRGKVGFAFETVLPEGYVFLLHSEASVVDLQEILPPASFADQPDFVGLTDFVVDQIWINTPQPQASRDFYQQVLPGQNVLMFEEAQGPDLLAIADTTWDLDSLRVKVDQELVWKDIEDRLIADYFKDKKEAFLQTTDPSNIEIWFEK